MPARTARRMPQPNALVTHKNGLFVEVGRV